MSKNDVLFKNIISYLKSKGKIRAALLSKLIKDFCHRKSAKDIQIPENELIEVVMKMLRDKIIHIIIPELFNKYWEKSLLKNLKCFEEGIYYLSKFREIKQEYFFQDNNDYLDTRKINLKDGKEGLNLIYQLKELITKNPHLHKKIIIYYPINSYPLHVYNNNSNINYKLDNQDFKFNYSDFEIRERLDYSLRKQRLDLSIMGKYRNSYMCFYIPLIESIQKRIMDLQKSRNAKNERLIDSYIQKFAYYCQMYVNSDWVDISKPNPSRWESFFKYFKIPIKILSFKFRSLKFHGSVFEVGAELKSSFHLKKYNNDFIDGIKEIGLKVLKYSNDSIDIRLDINFFLPCPSIEYFYFIAKYFYFYHLFLLFHYILPYTDYKNRFSIKEKNLYKIFLPVLKNLFIMNKRQFNKKLIFKYYTFNPDELELIYNKFLLEEIKSIEKKLYTYFIFRCSNLELS
jgi:hypothetical protein